MHLFTAKMDAEIAEFESLGDFIRKNSRVVMGPWKWRLPNPIVDPKLKPPFGGKYRVRKVLLIDGQVGYLVDPKHPVPPEVMESHVKALKDLVFSTLTDFALEQARKDARAVEVSHDRVI